MAPPAMVEKYRRGPVGFLTMLPARTPGVGKALVLWFIFSVVVTIFVAYLCGRTLTAGVDYLAVFRLAGTVAFLAYGSAEVTHSIWAGQPWSHTVRHLIDAVVYALITAGMFGWLFPGRAA